MPETYTPLTWVNDSAPALNATNLNRIEVGIESLDDRTAALELGVDTPVAVTYAASVTINAALGALFRVNASGNLTIADITGGTDGQEITIEVFALTADRTLSFAGGNPPAVVIPAGQVWAGGFRYRSSTDTWVYGGSAAYSDEQAQDAAASLLTTGVHSGISFAYNDAAGRVDATVTGGGAYTDEQAQDAAAALFTGGTHSGIAFVYNDAANRVDATVTGGSQIATALGKIGAIAVDTFSRADGALGTAESGQTWELQTGTPSISGGLVTATAAYVAAVDVGRSNMDVEATITPQASTAASLLFRVGPTSADRLAIALDTANGLRLNKTDTNTTTALATTAFTFTNGAAYRVRVIAVADKIYGYLNGELLLSHTLTSAEQTKYGAYTKAGIRQNGTTATNFDDFVVRYAYPAPTGSGVPAGAEVVYVATGDDADLTAALASAPASAVLVAVKVAGT